MILILQAWVIFKLKRAALNMRFVRKIYVKILASRFFQALVETIAKLVSVFKETDAIAKRFAFLYWQKDSQWTPPFSIFRFIRSTKGQITGPRKSPKAIFGHKTLFCAVLLIANLVSQPAVLQVLMDGRFVLAKRAFQEAPRSFSRLISIIQQLTAHLHYTFYQFSTGDTFVSYQIRIFCARKTPAAGGSVSQWVTPPAREKIWHRTKRFIFHSLICPQIGRCVFWYARGADASAPLMSAQFIIAAAARTLFSR
jgi:hypothetical protein